MNFFNNSITNFLSFKGGIKTFFFFINNHLNLIKVFSSKNSTVNFINNSITNSSAYEGGLIIILLYNKKITPI